MTFIRMAGCNLACVWCDQPDTIHEGYEDLHGRVWNLSFKKMSVADIMEAVPVSVERVCLTGGEPCAHKLSELVGVLHTMLHKFTSKAMALSTLTG